MEARFHIEIERPENRERRGRKKVNFDGLRINEAATQILIQKLAQVRKEWQARGIIETSRLA